MRENALDGVLVDDEGEEPAEPSALLADEHVDVEPRKPKRSSWAELDARSVPRIRLGSVNQ